MGTEKESLPLPITLVQGRTPNNPIIGHEEEMPLCTVKSEGQPVTHAPPTAIYDSVDLSLDAPEEVERPWVHRGHLLLFVVALLYGSLNVSLRGVYAMDNPPSASALSTVRGGLTSLCFLPLLRKTSQKNRGSVTINSENKGKLGLVKAALELAVWNFGCQGLANVGLLYIASARASFLTQLSVIITPLLSSFLGHRIKANVWWACGVAILGFLLLSRNESDSMTTGEEKESTTSHGFALSVGDLCCLVAAVSWSIYMVRMSAIGDLFPEVQLQAVKNVFMTVMYGLWCVVATLSSGTQWIGWNSNALAWIILLYSAAGPGTLADVWQQQGQTTVSATVANIILSLEPVFAALFGRVLLGETTSWIEKLGGMCILTAASVATCEDMDERLCAWWRSPRGKTR